MNCLLFQLELTAAGVHRECCDGEAGGRRGQLMWNRKQRYSMMCRTMVFLYTAVCQIHSLTPVLSLCESDDRDWQTHREVSVEVVFSVKQGLPVYGAVESQPCHHCCLDTSFVQDLGTQRRTISDKEVIQKIKKTVYLFDLNTYR